jgi:hypothetical protein
VGRIPVCLLCSLLVTIRGLVGSFSPTRQRLPSTTSRPPPSCLFHLSGGVQVTLSDKHTSNSDSLPFTSNVISPLPGFNVDSFSPRPTRFTINCFTSDCLILGPRSQSPPCGDSNSPSPYTSIRLPRSLRSYSVQSLKPYTIIQDPPHPPSLHVPSSPPLSGQPPTHSPP